MKVFSIIIIIFMMFACSGLAQELEYQGSVLFGGRFTALAIKDSLAFCAANNGLICLDIGTPNSIKYIGCNPFIFPKDICLKNDFGYIYGLYNGDYRLAIIDTSDPELPRITGFTDSLRISAIRQTGDYLIAPSAYAGYYVIDISDPYRPAVHGTYYNDYQIFDIEITDSIAYLACGYDALKIIKLADPMAPDEIASYHSPITDGRFKHIEISGSHAYIIADGAGQYMDIGEIIDINNPADPIYVSHVGLEMAGISLATKDDYLYSLICDYFGYANLVTFNIADPANPIFESSLLTEEAFEIRTNNGDLYICGDENALKVYSLADPAQPLHIGGFDDMSQIQEVAVAGDYVYAATSDGLAIINAADRTKPKLLSTLDIAIWSSSRKLTIADNYLFAGGYWLYILDISNPGLPELVNDIDLGGELRGICIRDNLAYVSSYPDNFTILDLSDINQPVVLGHLDYNGAQGLAVAGDYGYLLDRSGAMAIIDISNSSEPEIISECSTQNYTRDVKIYSNYALIAEDNFGVEIFDVSDPYHALSVGSYILEGTARGISIKNNLAFISNGNSGIHVIDISDPLNPLPAAQYDSPGNSWGCALCDNYIYSADWYSMMILSYSPTAIFDDLIIPGDFTLSPNYPNPFNASTTIRYTIPQASDVTLDIYDILGRKVRTLFKGNQNAGEYSVIFLDKDIPSGVYFYRLTAGEYQRSRKMILLK